jgi:DeoR family glycerol-3-phosphate regulon repressor
MKPIDRRERIAAIVKETSRVSVEELARLLSTSHETVRRDLPCCRSAAWCARCMAARSTQQTALESPYGDRSASARVEKLAIAERAALLFEPGDSLLVDAGSTTTAFAEALARAGHFTVITNSIMVAREMWSVSKRSDVYLLGGRYSGENHETVGPHAIEEIQRLHADHAVLTIGAIDPTGIFMDYNADEAYVARAMMASARQTTVLADSSKLGRRALFQVCEPRQVDRLVTDRPPPLPLAEALRQAGVDVLIAEANNY